MKKTPCNQEKITYSIFNDATTKIERARLQARKNFMYIKEWKQQTNNLPHATMMDNALFGYSKQSSQIM